MDNIARILDAIRLYREDLIAEKIKLTPEKKPILWTSLMQGLAAKQGNQNTRALPFLDQHRKYGTSYDGNDIINGSLLDYIQNLIDLYPEGDTSQTGVSYFYQRIKNNLNYRSFWNESLHEAIKFFHDYINGSSRVITIPDTDITEEDHSIFVSDLKVADAGFSFLITSFEELLNDKWVVPYWNINNESYYTTRQNDQVRQTLARYQKLQFTRTKQNEKWLRLLMPQYGRRTEIEDLDRNFWVISEVITSISKYLFDDDAPFKQILKSLLREITELWENTLYLWLNSGLISQNSNGDVRVIVLPVPSKSERIHRDEDGFYNETDLPRNSVRYDDFYNDMTIDFSTRPYTYKLFSYDDTNVQENSEAIKTELFNRIKYLARIYSEDNLCIIPYFKAFNYKHNYYAGEYYRYVFTYTRSDGMRDAMDQDNWDIWDVNEFISGTTHKGLMISPYFKLDKGSHFQDSLMSINWTQDGAARTYYPFNNIITDDGVEDLTSTDYFYAALRTVVTPTFDPSSKKVVLTGLNISVYDAMRDSYETTELAMKRRNNVLTKTELNDISKIGEFYTTTTRQDTTEKWIRLMFKKNEHHTVPQHDNYHRLGLWQYRHSVYLGECPSYRLQPARPVSPIRKVKPKIEILKLGGFYPYEDDNLPTNYTALTIQGYHTNIRGNVTTQMSGDLSNKTVNFYVNNWNTYDPSNDKNIKDNATKKYNSITASPSCFSSPPRRTNFNAVDLKQLSITAAKQFLQKTGRYETPYGFISYVGLTPYPDRHNVINWNNGGAAYFIFYLPNLSASDYEEAKALYKVGDDTDSSRIIKVLDQEKGYLFPPVYIQQYDTFCDNNNGNIKMSRFNVYKNIDGTYSGNDKLREFDFSTMEDSIYYEYSEREVNYHDGTPVDRISGYKLRNLPGSNNKPYFTLMLQYFDERAAQLAGQDSPYDTDYCVSEAPLSIFKDTMGQIQDGIIKRTGTSVNLAKNKMSTGFKNYKWWVNRYLYNGTKLDSNNWADLAAEELNWRYFSWTQA